MKTSPSTEAVPASIQRLLDRLADAGIFREFYLAGGTGLALLIEHRRSMDLDLFSRANRLEASDRQALVAELKRHGPWSTLESKDGTLHGRLGRVRVSFFRYPQPLVKPLLSRGRLRIASLEDIGLMKIGAIIGRGARKDFVDLYEICKSITLETLLKLGGKKFKDVRDFTLQALKALAYFEDAEREPEVQAVKPVDWDEVRRFFTRQTRALAQSYLA